MSGSPGATAPAGGPLATDPENGARRTALLWLAGAFCLSLPLTVQTMAGGEAWWDIALGRFIRNHGIPAADPFSFLAGRQVWVAPQWLFQVALAGIVRDGGTGLASLAMGLAAGLALVVAALAIPRASHTAGFWRAAAVLIGAAAAVPLLGVNGNSLTLLGVAATLLIVRRWREGGPRAVWLLPPLFLLWANCDPGFIAGLAILAFTLVIHRPSARLSRTSPALGRFPISRALLTRVPGSPAAIQMTVIGTVAAMATVVLGLVAGAVALVLMWALLRPVALGSSTARRPLLVASLVAAAATLLNPAGPRLYADIASTLGNPLISQLSIALQTPNFHNTLPRLIEVIAGLLVLAWTLGRPPRTEDCLLATALFLTALQASGAVGIFTLVAIPQLAEYGASAWAERAPAALRRLRVSLRPALAVGLTLLIALASAAVIVPRMSTAAAARSERSVEPSAAASFVATHFPGRRMLSSIADAGYLAYRFPSERIVFIDEAMAQFGTGPLRDYQDITHLTGKWHALLTGLDIDHAVLSTDDADTEALLEAGWTVNCYDAANGTVVMSAGSHPPAPSPPLPTRAAAC